MTSKTKPLHLSAAVAAAVDDEDMGAIMNEVFCPDALTRFLCYVRKKKTLYFLKSVKFFGSFLLILICSCFCVTFICHLFCEERNFIFCPSPFPPPPNTPLTFRFSLDKHRNISRSIRYLTSSMRVIFFSTSLLKFLFPLRIPLKASLNNFTHRLSSRSLGGDFPFLMVFYFNFKSNGFTKVNHPFACGKRRTSCNELQKRKSSQKTRCSLSSYFGNNTCHLYVSMTHQVSL